MSRPLALITGGVSGIGLAAAKELVAERDLALVYRQNRRRAEESRDALMALCPHARVFLFETDLSEYGNCVSAYEAVREKAGLVPEILIHCAGRGRPEFFVAAQFTDVMSLLNEHLVAALALTHAILPDMYRLKRGRIIFLGSVAAQAPVDGQAAYAAAKGGLESFTRALSREVFHRGITVNCVAPGLTETPLTERHIAKAKENGLGIEAHRPEEVAKAIKFLCSPEANATSGKILTIQPGTQAGATLG